MHDETKKDIELHHDDGMQHGIDDDPNNDPEKARHIGGVGGAVTGLAAGAAAGPSVLPSERWWAA
jgi:general stress protein YciG